MEPERKTVTEAAREIPVAGQADVVVVGGGGEVWKGGKGDMNVQIKTDTVFH